jgi:mono/diheme cytochrome c family protein
MRFVRAWNPTKTQRCRKFDQQCRHDRASGSVMSVIAYLLAFSAMVGMAMFGLAADARAQENLDRDKTGPKLFAASCVQCHKSARGLAKGRISFTLSYYLRSHYTSSSASADTLTAYLQSVDTPPAKAKRAAGKSQPKKAEKNVETRLPTGTISEDPRVRPPAKIPGR